MSSIYVYLIQMYCICIYFCSNAYTKANHVMFLSIRCGQLETRYRFQQVLEIPMSNYSSEYFILTPDTISSNDQWVTPTSHYRGTVSNAYICTRGDIHGKWYRADHWSLWFFSFLPNWPMWRQHSRPFTWDINNSLQRYKPSIAKSGVLFEGKTHCLVLSTSTLQEQIHKEI